MSSRDNVTHRQDDSGDRRGGECSELQASDEKHYGVVLVWYVICNISRVPMETLLIAECEREALVIDDMFYVVHYVALEEQVWRTRRGEGGVACWRDTNQASLRQ